MRADDPPALIGARPGLALPADALAAEWGVLGVCDAEVTPKSHDARVAQRAALVERTAFAPEPGDFTVAWSARSYASKAEVSSRTTSGMLTSIMV